MHETTITRSRPIDGGDQLTLWDPPQNDGVAGYAINTAICDNPQCTCARIWLDIRRLRALENGAFESFGPKVNADVSSDGTDLRFDQAAASALAGDVLDWIRQQLAQDYHRAWFHERWRRCRGQIGDPAYPSGMPPQDVDGLVFFYDVFPYDFDLIVVHDRRLYLAEDSYCLEPSCTCDEIALQFIDAAIDGKPLGHVRVSLRNLHAPVVEGPALVGQLWRELLERIGPARLRDRFQRMRKVAKQRAVTKTPVEHNREKTGRNDPCPCGSGKKYKRCCGVA